MKFGKKQACLMIAGIVSICCIICLISSITGIADALHSGGALPYTSIAVTLVTAVCTVMIWKGVRDMEN